MSKGYVTYLTLADGTIVTHTCPENEADILVYFEKPDDDFFLSNLKVNLSTLEVLDQFGFETSEVKRLIRFCLNHYDLIVKYSKVGE